MSAPARASRASPHARVISNAASKFRARQTPSKSALSRRVRAKATHDDALRKSQALEALDACVTASDLGTGTKYEGKVRDTYVTGDTMIAVTTDRQSAFDRHLAYIPFKGAVLNQTSQWWFKQTEHIVPNAVVATPDPNVTVMRSARCSRSSSSFEDISLEARRRRCGRIIKTGAGIIAETRWTMGW